MKHALLILLFLFLEPFNSQIHDGGRLMMMDKHMRRLNLTDIHFTDPNGIVRVDTVMNKYNSSREELIRMLKEKVNETAYNMVKSQPQRVDEWNKKAVDLPHPIHSSQYKKTAKG